MNCIYDKCKEIVRYGINRIDKIVDHVSGSYKTKIEKLWCR